MRAVMPSPLVNLLNAPWAIVPERLIELQAIYSAHARGENIDVATIEARLGRPLANEQKAYALQDGTAVAVLEVSGVIAPKANLFTQVSGGAAASLLQQQVQSMAADPRVRAVVLDIDTPGGNVLGIPALAQAVHELASIKPTVTVCTGMLASGGYWFGSAARAVYISGVTDHVGSIGVVATHTFTPRRDGSETTEITAGRYKRVVSDRAPLTDAGRAELQSRVDRIYQEFVDAVAQHRGVSAEQVLEHMAEGRVFIGRDAMAVGLVDGIATVDQMVERLHADPDAFAQRRRAQIATTRPPAAMPAVASNPGVTMTPQEQAAAFAAEHPEAAEHLRSSGATAERQRIVDVRAQLIAGHEQLVESMAFDGCTTGPEAAVAVLNAERSLASARASALASDAPPPLPAAATPTADDPADPPAAEGTPQQRARNLADAIAQKQAAASSRGRPLNASEALALVLKEQGNA